MSCTVLAIVTCGFVLSTPAQQPAAQPRLIKQVFEEDQADRANLDYSKLTKKRGRKFWIETLHGAKKLGSCWFQEPRKPVMTFVMHPISSSTDTSPRTFYWHTCWQWQRSPREMRPQISAATLDRYLQSPRQPQVFGTQYLLKDPDAVYKEAMRAITQDPYDSTVILDSLRKIFCVEPYAVQQQNISAMKEGKNPQPPSCQ